jgi:broad specificity phosphatase PhoE
MTDVYMTRHGETEWNVQVRMQGRNNSPLTEAGIAGAVLLKEQIKDIPFAQCYTSPLPRALHTASILIGGRSIRLVPEKRLAEMDLGVWEGVRMEDAKAANPEIFHDFRVRPDLFAPVSGGENFYDVVSRAQDFLKNMETRTDGPVLAVTHGILLQAIMMLCDGRDMSTLRSGQTVDQTRLFHIRYDGTKWQVRMRNGLEE